MSQETCLLKTSFAPSIANSQVGTLCLSTHQYHWLVGDIRTWPTLFSLFTMPTPKRRETLILKPPDRLCGGSGGADGGSCLNKDFLQGLSGYFPEHVVSQALGLGAHSYICGVY